MLESFSLSQYPLQKLVSLLGGLPFLGEVLQQASTQLETILEHCKIFKGLPKKSITKKGEYQPWIYFILQGECLLYSDNQSKGAVELLKPGQMFGELDITLDMTGQGMVVAASQYKELAVLALDPSLFLSQTQNRVLSFPIRNLFYRSLHQNFFDRLCYIQQRIINHKEQEGEEAQIQSPQISPYEGEVDGLEELFHYDIECKKLGLAIQKTEEEFYSLLQKNYAPIHKVETHIAAKTFNQASIDHFLNGVSFTVRSSEESIKFPKQPSPATFSSNEVREENLQRLNKFSFLVADDEGNSLQHTIETLQGIGVNKIHTEKDGMQAWTYLYENAQNVDVVICDWVMPNLTGLQILRKVKACGDRFQNLIFIMETSLESKTSVIQAVKNGTNGYLIKPFNEDQLFQQLKQAFQNILGVTLQPYN